VNCKHAIEIRRRQIGKSCLVDKPGIVDQMSGIAEGAPAGSNDRGHVVFLRNIAADEDGLSFAVADLRDHALAFRRTNVVDHDAISVVGQPQRHRPPDTRTRSGNDCRLHSIAS
jgi:hypothetical protein